MPMITSFYGIIIKMYFRQAEHNPPHIHAIYGKHIGLIEINTGNIIEGKLPDRALALVKEWISLYQKELLKIWNTQEFKKLPPLR